MWRYTTDYRQTAVHWLERCQRGTADTYSTDCRVCVCCVAVDAKKYEQQRSNADAGNGILEVYQHHPERARGFAYNAAVAVADRIYARVEYCALAQTKERGAGAVHLAVAARL